DSVACRVVTEHGDRVAALHHFPCEPLKAARMPFHLDLVPVHLQKAGMERDDSHDPRIELAFRHGGLLSCTRVSPGEQPWRGRSDAGNASEAIYSTVALASPE